MRETSGLGGSQADGAGAAEAADPASVVLRSRLGAVEAQRDAIAKEWLIGAIRQAPLDEARYLPLKWASEELPELITDMLLAVCDGREAVLGRAAGERARGLGTSRAGLTPSVLAGELARLQGELMRHVMASLYSEGAELQTEAASRIATAFGQAAGEAQEALAATIGPEEAFVHGMSRPEGLRRRVLQLVEAYRRHGHAFALTLFDVEGPGSDRVDFVARELRGRVRLLDETYRLEENELCVLAPFQGAADGARMAERLAMRLGDLGRHERWQVTISAGVSACPEHGDDPDTLLNGADTAMWRARATGRAVAVSDPLGG